MDDEELEMLADIQKLLNKTRDKIYKIFEDDYGYDPAYFDINILLKVEIDNNLIQVKEKHEKIPIGV